MLIVSVPGETTTVGKPSVIAFEVVLVMKIPDWEIDGPTPSDQTVGSLQMVLSDES